MTIATAARRLAEAGCVFAEEEAAILAEAAASPEELEALVDRRAAGEPLEYVVGWAGFRGVRFRVDPGVFAPRARSGLLVEEAASLARCHARPGSRVVVVDLCCGVGAIGAALAAEVPQVDLHAVDIDPSAVACAERNLAAVGGVVHRGDLFTALPRRLRRRIDVVVASPPYVPTGEIHLLPAEAREFEPTVALDGGPDGIDLVRRIAREAGQWLAPGGSLALEVAPSQLEAAAGVLRQVGFPAHTATSEEHGSAVVVGRRPL